MWGICKCNHARHHSAEGVSKAGAKGVRLDFGGLRSNQRPERLLNAPQHVREELRKLFSASCKRPHLEYYLLSLVLSAAPHYWEEDVCELEAKGIKKVIYRVQGGLNIRPVPSYL